jgi:regulator of sigma E protease
MLTVVIFLIVLAVLIFVHELGHFLFAKMFGIRVDAFKIGFGPKIFAWTPKKKDGTKGETEYGLNLIPFGGYVKIFGENPDDIGAAVQASSPSFVQTEQSRSMANKPRWQQAIVLVGGVLFNFLFAAILYIGLFSHGVTATADGFPKYVQYFSNQRIMITEVMPGSPADKAGLKVGDILLGSSISDIQNKIALSNGSTTDIVYMRNGNKSDAQVIAVKNLVADKYAIGIAMNDVANMKLPFFLAVYEGGHYAVDTLEQTVVGLYSFAAQAIHGTADYNQISGPVGIGKVVGDAARLGFTYLLMITALISINLSVINLLPFPALDGGRILFVVIESIIRRRIPAVFTNWVNVVGFGLLMLLMVIVTYKDIVKLFIK